MEVQTDKLKVVKEYESASRGFGHMLYPTEFVSPLESKSSKSPVPGSPGPNMTYVNLVLHSFSHRLSGWPKKSPNFIFTTKMVFPKSLNCMNSGSEFCLKTQKREHGLGRRDVLQRLCQCTPNTVKLLDPKGPILFAFDPQTRGVIGRKQDTPQRGG